MKEKHTRHICYNIQFYEQIKFFPLAITYTIFRKKITKFKMPLNVSHM